MCDPQNTETYELYEGCGHRLPKQACGFYADAWQQCLAAHDLPKDVKACGWKDGELYDGLCRFCGEGKDLDGAWKYEKKWVGREVFKK